MDLNKEYIVDILRYNNEGYGVCKVDNFIVFVLYALPLEKLKIKIDKIYNNYALGHIVEIIKESKSRILPICPYFYECGGCDLMHQNIEEQLKFKIDKIKSVFNKICNININLDEINSYNTLNYRNKVIFKVKNDKIGFFKEKSNDIVDIKQCLISNKEINNNLTKIRNFIKENKNHNISEIMIRVCNDKVMICIDNINDNLKDKFIDTFSDLESIYIKNKIVYGSKTLIQNLDNFKFNVSAKSFFQVNTLVAQNMYNKALSYIDKSDTIVDLYSGTGTLTILLSKKAKKVIGVEVVKEAVRDAKENLVLNKIENVEFICSKVENAIGTLKKENIDAIIMDPPRSGSDKKTLKSILEICPDKIVYISCNPITLARDYNILKEKYNIKEITAFDMFPNTYHVECVCFLESRKS